MLKKIGIAVAAVVGGVGAVTEAHADYSYIKHVTGTDFDCTFTMDNSQQIHHVRNGVDNSIIPFEGTCRYPADPARPSYVSGRLVVDNHTGIGRYIAVNDNLDLLDYIEGNSEIGYKRYLCVYSGPERVPVCREWYDI